jgi:hypothetical protein
MVRHRTDDSSRSGYLRREGLPEPMSSNRERRQADLFFADLMGFSRPQTSWRGWSAAAKNDAQRLSESLREDEDLKSGRVVFYDEDTLRFIEGWTRANRTDTVFLVNRGAFDPIRADGRSRSREFDRYLRRTLAGERDLQLPRSGNVLREALRVFGGEPR